jgi:hypothetical protein
MPVAMEADSFLRTDSSCEMVRSLSGSLCLCGSEGGALHVSAPWSARSAPVESFARDDTLAEE